MKVFKIILIAGVIVAIAVDPKYITEKVVVIDKVIIKVPQIFYEIVVPEYARIQLI